MKQIGLGMLNYENTKKKFPGGRVDYGYKNLSPSDPCFPFARATAAQSNMASGFVVLLPYIEETQVFGLAPDVEKPNTLDVLWNDQAYFGSMRRERNWSRQ